MFMGLAQSWVGCYLAFQDMVGTMHIGMACSNKHNCLRLSRHCGVVEGSTMLSM